MHSNRKNRRTTPKQKKARRILVVCAAVIAAVAAICLLLPKRGAEVPSTATSADSEPVSSTVSTEETPVVIEASPEPSEAEVAYQKAKDAAAQNATKDAPQVTDPALWNENGKKLMERLAADPVYQQGGIELQADADFPYLIAVNREASTVTVYQPDEENNYTIPYMAMVCSAGTDTPLGYYSTPINYSWRLLAGPSYGQYATRIWDAYLFHSVPYYSQHKDDVEYDEYNKLGTVASLGCIRLAVVDVKWIYDNCPVGTPVVLYDAEDPGPMGKPGTIQTDPADEALRGWDPTDPDTANPWGTRYLAGTAIRSEAAQQEWDAAQADGRWVGSINPTDLQGYSQDSSVVGTRG